MQHLTELKPPVMKPEIPPKIWLILLKYKFKSRESEKSNYTKESHEMKTYSLCYEQ
jgi:hypothetical protein